MLVNWLRVCGCVCLVVCVVMFVCVLFGLID